jgi:hypothetical protein
MSTTSTIALEYADGTIDQVYCHWDGHIETNGELLLTHYTDPFKLQKLIDLGDLSVLQSEVEPTGPHHFNNPQEGVCVFYGRDRGSDGTEAARFTDFLDYVQDGAWQGYDYILRNDGVWYVSRNGQRFRKLDDAIKDVA